MRELKKFIETHWDKKSPLLLGYSGGPDSKALLYGLIALGVSSLHVAHVDHGWREESALEAEAIRKEIESLSLPFHTLRLHPPRGGNREAVAREKRLAFFSQLHQKIPFQACLLAHQAKDLAETALKRVLEGAQLPFLGGMSSVSQAKMLPLWRPLLFTKRSEIFEFLRSKNLEPLIDPSNENPLYLRARMRMEIFPYLKEQFGKEFEENLILLSQRGGELKEYLDRKVIDRKMEKGPWGARISFLNLERIEARYLLQTLQPALPRNFLESIIDALLLKKPNGSFSKTLFADRGYLFFLSDPFPRFEAPLPLSLGRHTRGEWHIEVTECRGEPMAEPRWEAVWSGCFSASMPEGTLALPLTGSSFKDLWNQRKVPSFLRFQFPLLLREGKEIKEFLSGKASKHKNIFNVKFIFSTIREKTDN